jgi:hypothetical protein
VKKLVTSLCSPFIGVHVRYYDPSNVVHNHSPYWLKFDQAIDEIVKAVSRAAALVGSDLPVFLATDSEIVETALTERLKRVVTFKKKFAASPVGELHVSNVPERGSHAIIEMFALTHALALVRYPPSGSWFSELAASKCKHVIM